MKHVLLIMTDQHRSDYVGYVQGGKALTPNINRIASQAYFTRCTTTNPICTPARTSLITGRYSRQIGTLTMSGDLFPQIPTFMQALQKSGYVTYGIGKLHYMHLGGFSTPRGEGYRHLEMQAEMKAFGYDFIWETTGKQNLVPNYCSYADYLQKKGLLEAVRDFYVESGGINGDWADHNYDPANPWPFSEADYIDTVTGRVACEQLRQHPADRPFYMYVSFCGPHKVYDAPQRYLDLFPEETKDDFILGPDQRLTLQEKCILWRQRRSYKGMIKLIDDQIGHLLHILDERGMTEDTLIIFSSDHGDMLGDHGRIQKGVPWRQSVNVPLAVYLPGGAQIGAYSHPVQLMDIAATILDYAGLDPRVSLSRPYPAYNDRIPSRSFLPVLEGDPHPLRPWVYSESDFTEEHPDTPEAQLAVKKRLEAERQTHAWQMVETQIGKYIRYLSDDFNGENYEAYYDLTMDPDEIDNRISDPAYERHVEAARRVALNIMDHYPPAQLSWSLQFSGHRPVRAVEGP